jgi:hypothetical protein
MMCPVARGYRAGAASTRCIHQRGSRYRKPVQLLQKDASRTEGKHNEDSQGKARRRVLALPNGQTSVAISANSILQARERDVERVIPRTPSIAGAARRVSRLHQQRCCCLPALRGSRDPRPEYPISIPVTFAPTLQPGCGATRPPSRFPPLRLEVAEPVVAVTLLILVQSPASE